MGYLATLFIVIGMIGSVLENGKEPKKEDYPTGMELLQELRKLHLIDVNWSTFSFEKIDPYIFREYVFLYEVIGCDSREVALKKAFRKYKEKNYI